MSFVRQGTWMVLCTTVAGVFMFGVHGIVPLMGADAYSLYGSLLAIFQCMAIPAAGLQSVFALETAGARDWVGRRTIAGNLVGVLAILTGAWLVCGGALWFGEDWLAAKLKMGDARALWVTLVVILPHLWLPVLSGVLQGRQLFGWLGWTILGNGLGRFLTVGLVFLTVGGAVHWIMVGPLLGVSVALLLAAIACRDVLKEGVERVSWGRWLWRALPFALGPGVFQFMLLADNIAARVNFGELESGYYVASSMIGRALVMFMGPIAGVMFPKLVRETSAHKGAKLVKDTALATLLVVGVVSGLGLLGGLVFPIVFPVLVGLEWLPEGVVAALEGKESQLHWIARWAPMFLLAMGPLAISNVYISQLVANEQFRKIGVLGAIAVVYGLGLAYIPFSVGTLVLWVGLGNGAVLAGAYRYSQKLQRAATAE